MARVLTGNITVHGTDHEDFGPDEHPTGNLITLEPRVMNSDDGFIDLGMPTIKWGGECRVEVDWEAMLDGNDVITAHAICRFFEGSSEDTDEMEDQQERTFPVPKTRSLDPPTQFDIPLRNSTVVGAEDHAQVFFRLENRPFEDE